MAKKTTKKAAVSKSKAVNKKATAKERKPREKADLTPNQVLILDVLAKRKQATRGEISEKTGIVKGFSKLMGASTKGSNAHPDSLEAKGYIKPLVIEDVRAISYCITASGKAALKRAKAAK